MRKFVYKFFLAGDNVMLELHLRHPGYTYSVCGLYTKHRERIQKFRGTGDSRHQYRNELNKACFGQGASYSDSKVFS